MDERYLQLLLQKLEEQKQASINAMVDGQHKDYAEYRSGCGVVRGLALAQREINDLLRKMKDTQNED